MKVTKPSVEIDDAAASSAAMNELDEVLDKATLGFTKLNVLQPPHPTMSYNFGSVNNRAIHEGNVQKLLASFIAKGKEGGKAGSEIVILVEEGWLKPGSYTRDGAKSFKQLPMAEFTDAAQGRL